MSRRPRGPSERPPGFYYDPDDLESADAPRLVGQSFMSKLMVALLSLCCCGLLALILLAAASIYAQLPSTAPPTIPSATTVGSAAVVSISSNNHGRIHHMQRSVLHRIAMLRRAQPPQKGVDLDSVKMAFPHWLRDDQYDAQLVLPDIILTLSYLIQEDDAFHGP